MAASWVSCICIHSCTKTTTSVQDFCLSPPPPPPCFRIGGAEDNFIFYIEYCFFIVPVMKLRWEYNISKQFQSISFLTVILRAHFPPSKMLIGEKLAFLTQKPDFTLFHDFSASQPFSSAKNEQNTTLQLWQNSGETDLVTQIHQNMSKIGCFWAFSHFFCFWCQSFENFAEA